MKAGTVGLDIGNSVLQGHREDAAGRIVAQRRLRRAHVAMFLARQPASVVGLRFGPSLAPVLRALGMRCG